MNFECRALDECRRAHKAPQSRESAIDIVERTEVSNVTLVRCPRPLVANPKQEPPVVPAVTSVSGYTFRSEMTKVYILRAFGNALDRGSGVTAVRIPPLWWPFGNRHIGLKGISFLDERTRYLSYVLHSAPKHVSPHHPFFLLSPPNSLAAPLSTIHPQGPLSS